MKTFFLTIATTAMVTLFGCDGPFQGDLAHGVVVGEPTNSRWAPVDTSADGRADIIVSIPDTTVTLYQGDTVIAEFGIYREWYLRSVRR